MKKKSLIYIDKYTKYDYFSIMEFVKFIKKNMKIGKYQFLYT